MRLRTGHGAYVVAREDGALLHLPEPFDQHVQSVWDAAALPLPSPGRVESAVTQGPLAPSVLVVLPDGRVAFRREHLYLCADPAISELRFDRANLGPWERFAIETTEGTTFPLGSAALSPQPPGLSRPVLVETLIGYQIMTADAVAPVTVSSPDFSKGPVNRYTMRDGSWMVDVDSTRDPDQPFLAYWFYPFEARIHVWRLDGTGRRLIGYDLSDAEARSFLAKRRSLGAAITARLYLLALKTGDREALARIREDLLAAAEAGSDEALHAVLCDPLDYAPTTVRALAARASCLIRAANRARASALDEHLNRATVQAMAKALMRLDPGLRGISQDQLEGEIDFSTYFSDPKHLPPGGCTLPFTLHRHTEESLASLLGGRATNQTVGILVWPNRNAVDFHYVRSHMLARTILSIRYAYYVLCINQEYIWSHLTARDDAADVWAVRLEAGDAPTVPEPSVAFESWVGNEGYALVPDPYYFDTKGFQRGWFHGDAPPWSEKVTRFLWRGSTTGAGDLTRDSIWQVPRVRLCEAGRAIGSIADFGITNVVQTRTEADVDDIKLVLREHGLWRDPIPQHIMGGAKFLVEIDGNSNSWGFLAKLLMGCCVLKVDSPYEQWFYDRLQPWVHYVPVANDLSDLSDKVDWCLHNEETCREIAEAGQHFAESLGFNGEMAAAANAFVAVAWRAE
jgi:hypothetical protein